MRFTLEDWIALAAVGAAAAYLGRVAWRSIAQRRSGGCGGCAQCPAGSEASESQPIIELDQLTASVAKRSAVSQSSRDS
jgi:hypothetical protein